MLKYFTKEARIFLAPATRTSVKRITIIIIKNNHQITADAGNRHVRRDNLTKKKLEPFSRYQNCKPERNLTHSQHTLSKVV